jgi:thymidine kinase
MFSGKTEELIRRLRIALTARIEVAVFKPKVDRRYAESAIVSHDKNSISATAVESAASILSVVNNPGTVGIDEAQFFDEGLPQVCLALANKGIRVIVAGLDMDYLGKPFGSMPHVMAIADYVTKLHAVCVICGSYANFSFRTASDSRQVLIGEKESYEPRCRTCYCKKD